MANRSRAAPKTPTSGAGGEASGDQAARRTQILETVLALAEEGGYDAIQLREVSRRADVSSRTIYKYFGSRENLLLEAFSEWREADVASAAAAVKGEDFCERVLSIYRAAFDTIRKRPNTFRAFMQAFSEFGAGDIDEARDAFDYLVDDELSRFDADFAADFKMIVGCVTYATFLHFARGEVSLDQAWKQVERAVRRLSTMNG